MKVVINTCFGGFGLSHEGLVEYNKRRVAAGKDRIDNDCDIPRDDKDLVSVIEQMGEKSFGYFSKLKIIEIPDEVSWHVDEYDGVEHVAENHRTWR